MHRLILALALPVLAAGCANTMNGSIDDESVGAARDAIYDELEVGFGGLSVKIVYVAITGIPDACDALDALWSTGAGSCDDHCEEMGEVAADYLGGDVYWSLDILMFPEDDVDVEYDHGEGMFQDDFYAEIFRDDVSLVYDQAACEEACEDGDSVVDSDSEGSKDGTIEITSYDEGELIKGNYDIEFGGDDVVKGKFTAEHCDIMDIVYPY